MKFYDLNIFKTQYSNKYRKGGCSGFMKNHATD